MYNFDKIVNRRQTNSIKYDREKAQDTRIIPMWVADMDFETAPEIVETGINKKSRTWNFWICSTN